MALTADTLIQEIETMTVLELANLVKALEERFGVSAAAWRRPRRRRPPPRPPPSRSRPSSTSNCSKPAPTS